MYCQYCSEDMDAHLSLVWWWFGDVAYIAKSGCVYLWPIQRESLRKISPPLIYARDSVSYYAGSHVLTATNLRVDRNDPRSVVLAVTPYNEYIGNRRNPSQNMR